MMEDVQKCHWTDTLFSLSMAGVVDKFFARKVGEVDVGRRSTSAWWGHKRWVEDVVEAIKAEENGVS